jgi:membrane fusion protein (multidrug efflux system)
MTDSTANTQSPALRKRKKILKLLGILFLLVGMLWFLYWLIIGRFNIYTDDAYVNGNMVQLMSQIPGTVISIHTDDTHFVKSGQVLIQLDPADTQVALQRAQAALADTVRQVRQSFENALRAQETLLLRKADLIKAQLDVKRRQGLIGENAVSREEFQHVQTAEKAAQSQYNAALYEMRALKALVENSHLYTHPLVEQAKANFRDAYLNAQRATILAPVTGFIAKRSVQVGQSILVHTPMLAIVPLKDAWVDANYKESQLSDIRIGQPVTLYADKYAGVTYHGKVEGLSAGTGAAFSLLPPQNATGNWIKIVQRLPVRIQLNPDELQKNPLQLGLSMRVTTNTHDTSGPRLAYKPIDKPLFTTDIYAKQLADANHKIEIILKENSPDMFIPAGAFHE